MCLLLTPSITSSVYKLWLSVCSCSLSDWALSSNSLVSILMIVIWVMWHIIPTHSMQVHYALCLNIKLSIIQDCINTSKFSICWSFIHFTYFIIILITYTLLWEITLWAICSDHCYFFAVELCISYMYPIISNNVKFHGYTLATAWLICIHTTCTSCVIQFGCCE